MSQKCIVLRGLIASGKSTWAEQFIKDNQNYKRVNRDSFRTMLSNYTFNDENEKLVQCLWEESIVSILKNKYNLILDEMNLSENTYNKNINFIKKVCPEVEIEVREFPITLQEAIERDKKRSFVIGEKVIKNTYKKYEPILLQMLERQKSKKENLIDCYIFDVDGTTCNRHESRDIYDGSKAHLDYEVKPVTTIIRLLNFYNTYKPEIVKKIDVIILSGREDKYRKITEEWFENKNLRYNELYMRSTGDKRRDSIVKKELYTKYIEDKYNVLGVFDDRLQVLDECWQKGLHLFTFDVRQDAKGINDY